MIRYFLVMGVGTWMLVGTLACHAQKRSVTTQHTTTTTTVSESSVGDGEAEIARPSAEEEEQMMVDEINLVRGNPSGYVSTVNAYVEEQKAKLERIVSGKQYVLETIKVAQELNEQLKKTPKLSVLKVHEGVYSAAKKHALNCNRQGECNHQDAKGLWPWDRVLKEDPTLTDANECLVGGGRSAQESLLMLLIDAGIPNRGHRNVILRPEWKYVGVYQTTVGEYPSYWVLNFAY